jgi:hypothetical protein
MSAVQPGFEGPLDRGVGSERGHRPRPDSAAANSIVGDSSRLRVAANPVAAHPVRHSRETPGTEPGLCRTSPAQSPATGSLPHRKVAVSGERVKAWRRAEL